jgi:hypothetical protein
MAISALAWKYRQKLTVPIAVTGYTDLTNFPVLLSWTGTAGTSNLPSGMFDADGATPAKSNGGDLRFTLDKYGQIELPFELVYFATNNDPSLARAEIRVNIPNIYAVVASPFYVWWGNAAANQYGGGDTYGWYNCWNSGYAGVWHLTSSSAPFGDSTRNVLNSSTSANNSQADAKIYKGRLYNSSVNTAYIGIFNAAPLNMTAAITLSAWVNATNWTTNRRILQKGAGGDPQYRLLAEGGLLKFECKGLTTTFVTATLPSTGAWHLIHGTYDGANLRIFVDGAQVAIQAATGTMATSTDELDIGHKPASTANGDSFLGTIDECVVMNAALNSDWILTEYNNQNNPNTFIIQGAIETIAPLTGYGQCIRVLNDRTKLGSDEVDIGCPFIWTGSQATSNLPQEMMDADGGFSAKSDGSDLRFSSDINGIEQLAFEIVNFVTDNNPANARACIWVRVKFLSASANTPIYVWYKKATATAVGDYDAQGKQSCWRSGNINIVSIHHMAGTGNVSDSTLNGWTLINNGTTSDASGKFSTARAFLGSSSQYLAGNSAFCTIPNDFSIAFWMKSSATSNTGTQWYSGNGLIDGEVGGSTTDYGISYLNNKIAFGMGAPDTTIQSAATVNDGNWHHVLVTRVASTGAMVLYLDGTSSATGTGATAARTTATYHVGKIYAGTNYFTGSIDEIWMAQSAVSSTRVTSVYNAQNNPATFWSLGTPFCGDNFPMKPFGRMFMPASNLGFDRIL